MENSKYDYTFSWSCSMTSKFLCHHMPTAQYRHHTFYAKKIQVEKRVSLCRWANVGMQAGLQSLFWKECLFATMFYFCITLNIFSIIVLELSGVNYSVFSIFFKTSLLGFIYSIKNSENFCFLVGEERERGKTWCPSHIFIKNRFKPQGVNFEINNSFLNYRIIEQIIL